MQTRSEQLSAHHVVERLISLSCYVNIRLTFLQQRLCSYTYNISQSLYGSTSVSQHPQLRPV